MTPNRRLKQIRELRGWSQAKVAEQIGTDATTVSRWERGLFSPTPYFRERLCALFGKNAEELGLLESCSRPVLEQTSLPAGQLSAIFSSRAYEDDSEEKGRNGAGHPLMPPSWPKRTDTFTYILHSAAHDQQAHMLWEDAYVRALRGQYVEAQRLGHASLNEFARVGHMNASAVQEWLNQQDLASSPTSPENVPPMQQPDLSELHKRPARRTTRTRGTGIVLILLLSLAALGAGFSFSRFYPTAQISPLLAHLSSSSPTTNPPQQSLPGKGKTTTTTPAATSQPATAVTVTSTAATKPATIPAAGGAPTPTATSGLALNTVVEPAALQSQNCHLESLGYRCTLTLQLYASAKGSFSWSASSPSLPVLFNPTTGTSQINGSPTQVIVYIHSEQGEQGTLVFQFTAAGSTKTVTVDWTD